MCLRTCIYPQTLTFAHNVILCLPYTTLTYILIFFLFKYFTVKVGFHWGEKAMDQKTPYWFTGISKVSERYLNTIRRLDAYQQRDSSFR